MIDINSISTSLKCGDNEVWYAKDQSLISYPEEGNTRCYYVEDHSSDISHMDLPGTAPGSECCLL